MKFDSLRAKNLLIIDTSYVLDKYIYIYVYEGEMQGNLLCWVVHSLIQNMRKNAFI